MPAVVYGGICIVNAASQTEQVQSSITDFRNTSVGKYTLPASDLLASIFFSASIFFLAVYPETLSPADKAASSAATACFSTNSTLWPPQATTSLAVPVTSSAYSVAPLHYSFSHLCGLHCLLSSECATPQPSTTVLPFTSTATLLAKPATLLAALTAMSLDSDTFSPAQCASSR
ncbi:hypothetical protein Nepgr_000378 [Nepenthes gracilis]|uniref:Uncharacterized protein n=1 Tax=Nepenthes gracilis TaxID=150966 RepID=A0AAD3P686_NEPGR|nr:hypothetical protein Nepgr_000378 [Nepenthes gracilis]